MASAGAVHAARRLTFGATQATAARIDEIGLSAWVDEQLQPGAPPAAAAGVHDLPVPAVVSAVLGDQAAGARDHADVDGLSSLRRGTFARAAWSDHQLPELLVDFWSNHFSIAADQAGLPDHKVVDDRDVIRPHALGRFRDLLLASATSPAMLLYLDGASSRRSRPNENYARELLELHTVGVDGGYSQRDVRDTARVLTGLTVDADTGLFRYDPDRHYTGTVRVLGWKHANTDKLLGIEVIASLLDYLAEHPATARHLASKLVRRLVSDTPPSSLVASAASVYLASDTQIPPVVKHIALSREFAASRGRKTQRGLEWFVSAVRALDLQPTSELATDPAPVLSVLRSLGQLPFGWVPPDGYPDVGSAWASTASLLARWNAAQALAHGRVPGLSAPDPVRLLGEPLPTLASDLCERLTKRVLLAAPTSARTSTLLRAIGSSPGRRLDEEHVRRSVPTIVALLLSGPEMQQR